MERPFGPIRRWRLQWHTDHRIGPAARTPLRPSFAVGSGLRGLWYRLRSRTKQGEPPAAFALNEEAFVNFAHASYKKVRDAAVSIMRQADNQQPVRLYFVGSPKVGVRG